MFPSRAALVLGAWPRVRSHVENIRPESLNAMVRLEFTNPKRELKECPGGSKTLHGS